MIDLHTHSTFSDGSLTPEELVKRAKGIGLTALALTDHDCTDGLPRFTAACQAEGIRPVPGVEISADVDTGTLHMLGYFVDAADPNLMDVLREIRDGRDLRNHRILKKLNEQGLDLSYDDVASYAGEDTVGRPHFAQAMLDKGYIKTRQEAFDRFLAKGKVAYVDRFRLTDEGCIHAIRKAGGVPVLAHPFTLQLDPSALRERVRDLAAKGLGGLEVYYSEHSPDQQQMYLNLARETHLAVTGGSDFHGAMNPDIELGRGFGSLRIPDSLVDELAAKR
jgi:hypothetical protein